MEKKEVGGLLVFISLILFIGSYFLFGIFIILGGIFIKYLWIVGILTIAGIISVLIGGLMGKKDLGYWLVLFGVIMIFGAIFLDVFYILRSEIFTSFEWINVILLIMGFISIVIGGLMENKKEKTLKI